MTLPFSKYHGTGNDFILFDNRSNLLDTKNIEMYKTLCHRRFGIGADGVIFIQHHADYDFEMVYLNADGRPSSMCGNGGRCVVAFAKKLGIISQATRFLAIDGEHEAAVLKNGQVSLKMIDVPQIDQFQKAYILNTGSPHYVEFTDNLAAIDVYQQGKNIRNSPHFKAEGINVNFVQPEKDSLHIATYERGVEDITYSCGTGVVACCIASAFHQQKEGLIETDITTKGGKLQVRFQRHNDQFTDIWLTGPAVHVFDGVL